MATMRAGRSLSKATVFFYAVPGFMLAPIGISFVMFAPAYYSTHVGMSVGLIAALSAFARAWDVFTDPVVGVLQDRTRTRLGRRRVWLIASVPLIVGPAAYVFFAEPGAGPLYLIGWVFLLYLGFTMAQVSSVTWGAELAPTYDERSRLSGWRETAGLLGMVTMLVLAAATSIGDGVWFSSTFGWAAEAISGEDGPQRLAAWAANDDVAIAQTAGWFILIGAPLLFIVSALFTPEPRPAPHEPMGLGDAWRTLAGNKLLRQVAIADLFSWTAVGILQVLFPFFAIVLLGDASMFPVLLLTYLLTAALALPVWIAISYRLGKHRTLILAALCNSAATPLLFLIQPGLVGLAIGISAVTGIFYGAMPFLMRAMFADVAEADQAEHGEARWGLINSIHLVSSKGGSFLGFAFLAALAWFGFDPKLGADNTLEAKNALRYLAVGGSIIANLATVWVISRYSLDRAAQARNRAAIDAKRS